jgi:hypothetical protein
MVREAALGEDLLMDGLIAVNLLFAVSEAHR